MNPFRNRAGAIAVSALCSAFVFHCASAAELLERAVLPSATFSPGPTSSQYAPGANGVVTPFIDKQPVQGLSGIRSLKDGTFLTLTDNGFGSKANSPDAMLMFHIIKPDWKEIGRAHV